MAAVSDFYQGFNKLQIYQKEKMAIGFENWRESIRLVRK